MKMSGPAPLENLTGTEVCDNCGADLAGHDVPQPALSFHGRLLGEHLDELGAPPPLTVGPDTPLDVVIARMHDAEADCVLVDRRRPPGRDLHRSRRRREGRRHAAATRSPSATS